MARSAHALLLIASLLACPYQCSGVVGAACAAADQPAPCSCCAKHGEASPLAVAEAEPEKPEQAPAVPAQHCRCGNCLCHGAVKDDDSTPDAFFAGFYIADLLPQTASLADGGPAAALDEDPPLPACIAGRPLRLVLQSLQI